MVKIIRSADCGNSPKNQFIENMEIALARHEEKYILQNVTEDVDWQIIGKQPVHGKSGLAQALKAAASGPEITEIVIQHVVSHGRAGAVNDIRKHRDGRIYDFCTIYEFGNSRGDRIRKITHYAIARTESGS